MIVNEPFVDNSIRVEIPIPILEYAKFSYHYYTPVNRKSGFNEISGQFRGEGDLLDLIAKLTLFDYLATDNKVSSIELTTGFGDSSDITTITDNEKINWNIKTSKYAPYSSRLNLFIKREELQKNLHGYIQVFVHLEESTDTIPHIHIAGFVNKNSEIWQKNQKIITIPRTNHLGIKIPIVELEPIQLLISKTDTKF